MPKQGKRLKAAYAAFDREKTYALDEAVKLVNIQCGEGREGEDD